MNFAGQSLAMLLVNLSGVRERMASVLTIIIGVTCAVGVLVSMLAMGTGARRQEMGNVRADRVILITSGARVFQSDISREEAAAVFCFVVTHKIEEALQVHLREFMHAFFNQLWRRHETKLNIDAGDERRFCFSISLE